MCIECIRVSFTACVLVPSCKITQLTRYHMEISNHPELMYTCAAHDAAGTHSPSCVEGNNPFSLPLPRFHASAATLRRPTARAAAVTSSSRHVIVASRHRRSHLPLPCPHSGPPFPREGPADDQRRPPPTRSRPPMVRTPGRLVAVVGAILLPCVVAPVARTEPGVGREARGVRCGACGAGCAARAWRERG